MRKNNNLLLKVQNSIRLAFIEANSEIISSKDNVSTKSLSMDRIASADSLLSTIVDLKQDSINLSFEKLLSQLAIETATVR